MYAIHGLLWFGFPTSSSSLFIRSSLGEGVDVVPEQDGVKTVIVAGEYRDDSHRIIEMNMSKKTKLCLFTCNSLFIATSAFKLYPARIIYD